jgi:hypothetical protein
MARPLTSGDRGCTAKAGIADQGVSTLAGGTGPWLRSELDHPGERRHDPHLPRREVDDHGGITLDKDDPPEPVLVMSHQIVQCVPLDGRSLGRGLEGT